MTSMRKISRQKGFTLVEVGLVLIIVTILAAYKLREESNELRMAVAKAQGEQLKVAGKGLYNYALSNFSQIVNDAAVTGVANPNAPTIDELKALGHLESGFNASNFYGGTYQFTIGKSPSTCTTNCNIAGLAYTSTPIRNPIDNQVDGALIGQAINAIGADGGASTKSASAIQGKGGGWSANNPAGAVTGILAMRVGEGSALDLSAYLRRDGTMPMTGNLDMGGQSIENLAVESNGASCVDIGALATTSTGEVLSCQNNTWQQQGSAYWKDPVSTVANLPTCNSTATWQTRLVVSPTIGAKPVPYSCNGTTWVALLIDDAGNLTVPSTVTLGKMQVNDVVVEGTACAPNGLVARDANGLILSCQSGVYKEAFNGNAVKFGGGYAMMTGYGTCSVINIYTKKCSCPSGYSAIQSGISGTGSYSSAIYTCQKL